MCARRCQWHCCCHWPRRRDKSYPDVKRIRVCMHASMFVSLIIPFKAMSKLRKPTKSLCHVPLMPRMCRRVCHIVVNSCVYCGKFMCILRNSMRNYSFINLHPLCFRHSLKTRRYSIIVDATRQAYLYSKKV